MYPYTHTHTHNAPASSVPLTYFRRPRGTQTPKLALITAMFVYSGRIGAQFRRSLHTGLTHGGRGLFQSQQHSCSFNTGINERMSSVVCVSTCTRGTESERRGRERERTERHVLPWHSTRDTRPSPAVPSCNSASQPGCKYPLPPSSNTAANRGEVFLFNSFCFSLPFVVSLSVLLNLLL